MKEKMTPHDVANKLQAMDKHVEDIINTTWVDGKTAQALRNNWRIFREMLVTSVGRGIYIEATGDGEAERKITKPELIRE